jgi:hypothetical protein
MLTRTLIVLALLPAIGTASLAADWPQGPGAGSTFQTASSGPTAWSVVRGENIRWKITLPETGQSTPVVCGERVFFTTMVPVDSDAKVGTDIVAWCCDVRSGDVIWKRDIPGKHPLRLSGCFSDSSAPPAVCDGERVVFVNASGTVVCFDLNGKPVWSQPFLSVGRTIPFVHDGRFVFTRQNYPPDPDGNFPHKYKDSPAELWTQLQALDMKTGHVAWTSTCGVNMGCVPLLQKLADSRSVIVVGRGGGHGPPEKPDGISLLNADDGSTLWTLPLDGFMSTMSYSVRNDRVHLFHKGDHLSVDALSGKLVSQVSIINHVAVRKRIDDHYVSVKESIPDANKGRMITQSSNLLVGRYHYFRSYTQPYLGRVNIDDQSVEYLELPLQLSRTQETDDMLRWYSASPDEAEAASAMATGRNRKPKATPLNLQAFAENDMKNSRGFVVMGDARSKGNGWGHIAAPSPTVAGENLYVPVMNGTVYVLKRDSEVLDESAIVAINDLGPAGQSWTRGSVSFADGRAFAHTIRELICIENVQ